MRFVFLLGLMLAGCAGEPVYRPVEVSVPIAVPCKASFVREPVWSSQKADVSASLFERVKAALVEIDLRKAYEADLRGAVLACQ